MTTLHGYQLIASRPNENGYCTFKLIEITTGEEIAHTDEPGTLEDALIMARKFVEELEETQ